jgi:glycosyltransferase involved in cell wall biosynthesis
MANLRLSVIIPSYRDPLLHKTIDSMLQNSGLGDQLEIIPVLDGYWPEKPIIEDERVRVVHLGTNGGMRNAINNGVRVARGEYILRADEHNMFGERFDLILTSQCEPNWIVTPRRYFLDPVKWEVMDMPPIDYAKLKICKTGEHKDFEDETKVVMGEKFSGVDWPERAKERINIPIDETMAMQGSCWIMPHKWWDDVIGELQTEGYGPLYQDSHEMVFKTWKAGGKLMVNKNTWHAHKHRSFPRTHNNGSKETPSNNEACFAYSLKVWREYFEKEIAPKWNM